MMLAESSCRRKTTMLHCSLKAYKALGKPLQLYGHVVTVLQTFKLPVSVVFGHLSTGGVVEPLWCDASRVFIPWTNHSVVLPLESI